MKYPLQKEIENDMVESLELFGKATFDYNSVELLNKLVKEIARSYVNAIQRISKICKDRNRF